MILYRGTPFEEDWPESHDHGVIFMTNSTDHASMYGQYVQVYEVGKPKLLNLDSKIGLNVIKKYRKLQPQAFDHRGRSRVVLPWIDESHELAIHPENEWLNYIAGLGYDGYRHEGYNIVALFDSDTNQRRFQFINRLRIEIQ